jgi:hypothetical protein
MATAAWWRASSSRRESTRASMSFTSDSITCLFGVTQGALCACATRVHGAYTTRMGNAYRRDDAAGSITCWCRSGSRAFCVA